MLPMLLQKHTMITAALVASLSMTACGSKKDVYDGGKSAQKTAAPKAEDAGGKKVAKSDDNKKTSDTNGKLGGGLANPADDSDDSALPPLPHPPEPQAPVKAPAKQAPVVAPAPAPAPIPAPAKPAVKPQAPKAPAAQQAPKAPAAPVAKAPAPQQVVPAGQSCQGPTPSILSVSSSNEAAIPNDYESSDVRNLSDDSLSKRFTGGIYGDGLFYTSSSTDDLLTFLRARNQRVDQSTRQANLAAAGSVQFAQLSVESMSNDAIVTLKIKEQGSVKIYNLAGGLEEGVATRLRAVRSGNGTVTTGTRAIEATAKCLDLDGGCETTFVRVKIGEQNCSAIINVVFRKSISDLYFNFAAKSGDSDNREFLILRDFFMNTIKGEKHTDNKIAVANMSSWEVVNGKSGAALSMLGLNNEFLAFGVKLVAPEAGTSVNLPVSRIAKDADDSLDLLSLNQYGLNYANTIGDVRMIANNGLGQVRIMIKMRKRANYPQDKVAITFMRRIKPLVDLNDDNLK